jgi:CheY-like chemotaxis protein
MKNFKLLVAVSTPSLQGLLPDILGRHTLVFAANLEKALALLEARQDFDLILCGLHFDSGKMYELLEAAKSSKTTAHIPFLCVQLIGSILPYGAFKSMRAAFDILGGDLFIQVAKWRIEYGDEEAFRKFNDVILNIAKDPQKKGDLIDIALDEFN